MVNVNLSLWLIEGVWRNWNIAPCHDPFVTCRRTIATNWIGVGMVFRDGMVSVTVDIRLVSRSLHQVSGTGWKGAVFHSLFIGDAIVHIYNGDLRVAYREIGWRYRASVLQPNLTVVTSTDRGRITRSACCKTHILSFCFLKSVCCHVVYIHCFYIFGSGMLMGCVFHIDFFFLLFIKSLLRCPGQAFKHNNHLKE
jgi:hypothetical protein